jgi:hypothetical protein
MGRSIAGVKASPSFESFVSSVETDPERLRPADIPVAAGARPSQGNAWAGSLSLFVIKMDRFAAGLVATASHPASAGDPRGSMPAVGASDENRNKFCCCRLGIPDIQRNSWMVLTRVRRKEELGT